MKWDPKQAILHQNLFQHVVRRYNTAKDRGREPIGNFDVDPDFCTLLHQDDCRQTLFVGGFVVTPTYVYRLLEKHIHTIVDAQVVLNSLKRQLPIDRSICVVALVQRSSPTCHLVITDDAQVIPDSNCILRVQCANNETIYVSHFADLVDRYLDA